VFAVVASALMFLLQEQVLAYANRRAEAIRHEIRGGSPRTFDVVNRKWLVARDGDIYNYLFYDPSRRELNGLSIFQFDAAGAAFAARTYVAQAAWDPDKGPSAWRGKSGWIREFTPAGETKSFALFPTRDLRLEPPDYFATESPDADRMSYAQLRRYISDLRASGFNVVPQTVALHRKISFPFVTLIMTLIAVPFAVTTGRRGALYGIAVGIVLAVVYWLTTNAFGAIGSAGMLAPVLAAWAPNLIFGAGAAYLLLTVRT
jgi:lipopolysaccharide export LptBFGC system permease protein LptF